MLFAGNCGFNGTIGYKPEQEFNELFAEEAGWLVEYLPENETRIFSFLKSAGISYQRLGETFASTSVWVTGLCPARRPKPLIHADMKDLREEWETTSYYLELEQCNPYCANQEDINIYNIKNPPYKLSFTPEPTSPKVFLSENRPKVAIIREEGSNGDREMAAYFAAGGFECWDVNMTDLLNKKADLKDFRGVTFVGGFSYADTLDSAKGWAATILFNADLRKMFDDFYNRPDTFSLSICNGCQLAALLGWVPVKTSDDKEKIRFIKNESGRFESRFSTVAIFDSPAIMLEGMAGSVLGIWCAHGEGKLHCNEEVLKFIKDEHLAPIRFINGDGNPTDKYPFNPNGSVSGITGVCDETGRHLAMMPHPERVFLKWQWAYMPEEWKKNLLASPWLKMVQNAYEWCVK
jgi:phosphoribosylformylglycinamidine synthase